MVVWPGGLTRLYGPARPVRGGVQAEGGQVAGVDVLQRQVGAGRGRGWVRRGRGAVSHQGSRPMFSYGAEDEAGAGEQDRAVEGAGGEFAAAFVGRRTWWPSASGSASTTGSPR